MWLFIMQIASIKTIRLSPFLQSLVGVWKYNLKQCEVVARDASQFSLALIICCNRKFHWHNFFVLKIFKKSSLEKHFTLLPTAVVAAAVAVVAAAAAVEWPNWQPRSGEDVVVGEEATSVSRPLPPRLAVCRTRTRLSSELAPDVSAFCPSGCWQWQERILQPKNTNCKKTQSACVI